MSHWYPDHVTGKRYFLKPGGNSKTIIEAGGPKGMIYSGLLEIPYEKGCFILSRLTLEQDKNPVARKILENCLTYKLPNPLGKLGIIASPNVDFIPILNKFGIALEFTNIYWF